MQLKTKDLALMCIFAALYTVLSLVSLFPIIGAAGGSIKLASILAPLIGILLGPYIGVAAASLGGFLGWSIAQTGAFGFFSFVPGGFTAFCSGLLYSGKRMPSVLLYVVLFLPMAFYPTIGPFWLFPYFLWFQLVGLAVLASPLTSLAVNSVHMDPEDLMKLSFGVGIISLVSTLVGQIAGSFVFELLYWPTVYPQIEYWRISEWQFLTPVYPLERSIITLLATIVGTPLIRAIRAYGFEMGGT